MSEIVSAVIIAVGSILSGFVAALISSKVILKPRKSARLKRWKRGRSGEIIPDAEKELFFCSASLSWIQSYDNDLFIAADRGVRIRLLVMNVADEEIRKTYTKVYGRKPTLSDFTHLMQYVNQPKFEVRVIDCALPMFIAASDMEKPTGFIQVAFPGYGDNKLADCDTCVDLTPKKDLYDHYKAQIERLWEHGYPQLPQLLAPSYPLTPTPPPCYTYPSEPGPAPITKNGVRAV